MSIVKVALTGGIASGKTKVSQYLAKQAIDVIDLDVIARAVVAPNSAVLAELVARFSTDIVNEKGELKRAKLRQIMFSDAGAKNFIEGLIQPEILIQMQQQIARLNTGLVVVVVPLLIEKKINHLFDKSIVVLCQPKQQIARLIARDCLSQAQAENILKQQASYQARLLFIKENHSFMIDNSQDDDFLKKQLNQLIKKLRDL